MTGFLERYLPKFYRAEQRQNATLVIRGLLSGLERKTGEPIAIAAGVPRKPIQFFVGAGLWDDEAVMGELRLHVREDLADPDGVVVVDPSAFPKKGTESCGVARQWCGRLGKVDNCQVGVFLAYAAAAGYAPLDRRLYLPEDWADDAARAAKMPCPAGGQVPGEVADRPGPAGPEPARPCPTAGSSATTSSAGLPSSGPHCGCGPSVTSWTCRATPWCATWSDAAPAASCRRGRRTRGAVPKADAWAARQPESRWKTDHRPWR